jgi:diaminopimelate epimerase
MFPFLKMNGLGNDFVVIDVRGTHKDGTAGTAPSLALDPALARRIADRRRGVGCDQLVVIECPRAPEAIAFLRFLNADGGEAGACGNGARCVAAHLMQESGAERIVMETKAGLLSAELCADGSVSVDLGPALLDWRDIPLAHDMDTLHLDLSCGGLPSPVAVSMGNPHCVFFVEDADAVDIERLGPIVETAPLFPERTNVEFVSVRTSTTLRMRVWERGVGITQACGSGACAVVVAAHRRGLTERAVEVQLDGGSLFVTYRDDGHVVLRGPVAWSFTGEFDPADDPVHDPADTGGERAA